MPVFSEAVAVTTVLVLGQVLELRASGWLMPFKRHRIHIRYFTNAITPRTPSTTATNPTNAMPYIIVGRSP